MTDLHRILTARDIMTRRLITLRPDMSIFEAIRVLLKNSISGAPVVGPSGDFVGMLSELDCLHVLASSEFHSDDHSGVGHVEVFMTQPGPTIEPELGIYAVAHKFFTHAVRRLPVLEDGRLVGQVSRRDVLKGIEKLRKERTPTRYPDYRAPG